MRRILPIITALLVIVAFGVCNGLMSGRWGHSEELAEAARRLQDVPMTVGDWQAESEQAFDIPERALQIGEIDAYLSRRYVRHDGRAINVLIVCGRPGPISVHTPDVCFRGAGFVPQSIKRHSIPQDEGSALGAAWVSDFSKQTPTTAENLRVFWTWGRPSTWEAPDNPRRTFAGSPFLYKLYLTRPTEQLGESIDDDLCVEFLQSLLPQLNETLFQ